TGTSTVPRSVFSVMIRPRPTSTLFPYTTLFRSGLVAAIVFHAFNGIRVVLVDFWSKGTRHQKTMMWIVIGLTVVLMAAFLPRHLDRKSTRLNSSHVKISYAVFCLKKKKTHDTPI